MDVVLGVNQYELEARYMTSGSILKLSLAWMFVNINKGCSVVYTHHYHALWGLYIFNSWIAYKKQKHNDEKLQLLVFSRLVVFDHNDPIAVYL